MQQAPEGRPRGEWVWARVGRVIGGGHVKSPLMSAREGRQGQLARQGSTNATEARLTGGERAVEDVGTLRFLTPLAAVKGAFVSRSR